jgi:hypothetical protein
MTNTNFNEFKKLYYRIPKERLEYVHFISLRTGTKIPMGNWKGKEHLNIGEVKTKMGFGGNIAVVAIPKGLMFLDIDTNRDGLLASAIILEQIPKTFTVKTRSGGLHYYFLNNGEYTNQRFVLNGVEVGELRTNWQYVVSCCSWVEPETYRCLLDTPIARFEGEITQYFKKSDIIDSDETNIHPSIYLGKVGKPLSEKTKRILEGFYGKG